MDKFFTTSDGARLHYIEEGAGRTVVMIHGWGCTAELYKYQIEALKNQYHVIAVDLRGHGDSPSPGYGFHISRMAKDIHEIVEALPDEKVVLVGHSMGCSIIWSYIELFSESTLEKIVLIDEDPVIVEFPTWSEEEHEHYGGLFTPQLVFDTVDGLKKNGIEVGVGLLTSLFTADASDEIKAWAAENFRKGAASDNADLIFNHAMNDWATLIPRITVPALVYGGKMSAMNYKSMEWVGSVIKNAETCIMEKGSSHFMFIENPEEFNARMLAFLG